MVSVKPAPRNYCKKLRKKLLKLYCAVVLIIPYIKPASLFPSDGINSTLDIIPINAGTNLLTYDNPTGYIVHPKYDRVAAISQDNTDSNNWVGINILYKPKKSKPSLKRLKSSSNFYWYDVLLYTPFFMEKPGKTNNK
jgi:hypothetical protein